MLEKLLKEIAGTPIARLLQIPADSDS